MIRDNEHVVTRNSCKPFPGLVWDHRQSRQGRSHLCISFCLRSCCRGDPGQALTVTLWRCGEITFLHWDVPATLSSTLDLCRLWRFLKCETQLTTCEETHIYLSLNLLSVLFHGCLALVFTLSLERFRRWREAADMRYHITDQSSAIFPKQDTNIRKSLPHSFPINFGEIFAQRRGVGMKARGDIAWPWHLHHITTE